MKQTLATLAILVTLLVTLPPTQRVTAENTVSTIRIGVVDTLAPGMPAGLLSMAMKPFRSYMEEQTGLAGDVARGGDAFGLAQQLKEGAVQVGIFHGHEYAWARSRFPDLAPVVICIGQHRAIRALLVVPGTSTATGPADLAGKSLALPRDARAHCRVFLEGRCTPPMTSANKAYRLSRPSDTVDTLDDLGVKKFQAAVVDEAAFERYRKAYPARARKLKVLGESESFPPGVIAYHKGRIEPGKVRAFQSALLAAKDHPRGVQSLNLLKMATFEPASEEYEAALKAIVQAYPVPAQ